MSLASLRVRHNCDADLSSQTCCYCGAPVFWSEEATVVTDGETLGIAHDSCNIQAVMEDC